MLTVRCGDSAIGIDPALERLAQGRCHTQAFVVDGLRPSVVVKRETLAPSERRPLEGSPAPWGYFSLAGDTVFAEIPDDMWAAESILRIAWQLSTVRQGGVLMHGSAVGWGPRGIAAIGHSGAGKSTLARLCSEAPGAATLLTDEIVQLFPDGRLFGTPFRSDTERPGTPGELSLATLLLLEKGPHEAMAPVSPSEAAPLLLGQLFRPISDELSHAAMVRCVLTLIDRVGVHRLTFRKDPAVGPFLREWLVSRGPS